MFKLPRTYFIAIAAVGALLAGPLLATTSASAAIPGAHVLFVSNAYFSDPVEEDAEVLASIATTGAAVTIFDGGDASAAAWTDALVGIDLVVIPEASPGNPIFSPAGTPVMSAAAAAILKDWVTAGGDIVALGAYSHEQLLSYFTDLDYSVVWDDLGLVGEEWLRQPGANPALPSTIPEADYAGGLVDFSTWDVTLLEPVTPWYLSEDGTNLGVASFAIGSGSFVYVAYDWFPDEIDVESGARAIWDTVLQSFFVAPAAPPVVTAAPELAATGVDLGIVPIGSALIVLGLIAFSLARVRRAKLA